MQYLTSIWIISKLTLVLLALFVLPYYPAMARLFPERSPLTRALGALAVALAPAIAITYTLITIRRFNGATFAIVHLLLSAGVTLAVASHRRNGERTILREFAAIYRDAFSFRDVTASAVSSHLYLPIFIAIGGALRFHHALTSQSLGMLDPWAHMLMANNLSHGLFFEPLYYGTYPRGLHAIYLIFSAMSNTDLFMTTKYLGPLFGTITIAALFALTYRLFGKWSARFTAALYCTTPFAILLPPLPIWYSPLLGRQAITIPENPALILMGIFVIWFYDLFTAQRFSPKHALFIVAISFALALIHPITVLYTFGILALLFFTFYDRFCRDLKRWAVSFLLILVSPVMVRAYFWVTQRLLGAPSMENTADIQLSQRAMETVEYIPFFHNNAFYSFIVILAGVLFIYGATKNSRPHTVLGMIVGGLALLSMTGMLRLYSSTNRPRYYLTFFMAVLFGVYADLGSRVYRYLRSNRALARIPSSLRAAWARLLALVPPPGAIGCFILVYLPCAASLSMLTLKYGPRELYQAAFLIAVLCFLLTLRLLSRFAPQRRLYTALLAVFGPATGGLLAVLYAAPSWLPYLFVSSSIIAILATLFHSPKWLRAIIGTALTLILASAFLYLIPHTPHQTRLAPLVAIIGAFGGYLLLSKLKASAAGGVERASRGCCRFRPVLYLAVVIALYSTLRLWLYQHLMPDLAVGAIMLIVALPALVGDWLLHKSRLRYADIPAIIALAAFIFFYPSLDLMAYERRFILGLGFSFLTLLLVLLRARANRPRTRAGASHDDTFLAKLLAAPLEVVSFILMIAFLSALLFQYPPLVDYIASLVSPRFMIRTARMSAEWVVLAALSLAALFGNLYALSPRRANTSRNDATSQAPHGRFGIDGGEESTLIRTIALIAILVIFLPPGFTTSPIQTWDFEQWPAEFQKVRDRCDPNVTTVYTEVNPPWLPLSYLSPQFETHNLSRLLSNPPNAYIPENGTALICVDKYDYQQYSQLDAKYFEAGTFQRTERAHAWVRAYEDAHGNGSVVHFSETAFTVIYQIN